MLRLLALALLLFVALLGAMIPVTSLELKLAAAVKAQPLLISYLMLRTKT